MPLPRDEHFRERAAHLRELAESESDPKVKTELLWIADQYDEMAKRDRRNRGPSD
jgi:hypothetical protein